MVQIVFLSVVLSLWAGGKAGSPFSTVAESPYVRTLVTPDLLELAQGASSTSGGTRSVPIEQSPLSDSALCDALAGAVQRRDADMVRRLLERGARLNGSAMPPLLTRAAQTGQAEIVRLLLDVGANVDAKDEKTRTALMYAAQGGYAEIATMLLAKGANANARNDYPREYFKFHGTPAHRLPDNQMSALMYAAQGGHTQIVAALVARGAKVNAEAYYEETALMYAAAEGRTDTVLKLLELGANLRSNADDKERKREANGFGENYGGTALLYAVRGRHAVTAKALVAEYMRTRKTIEEGEEIFYYALHAGDLDLVRTLAEQGIDTRKDHFLPTAARRSSMEIFKFLLDRVADEEFRNGRVNPSVLNSAAASGVLAKVKLVMERGADVNARDRSGLNALYWGVYQSAADVVSYLLEKGIEVNVVAKISLGSGDTALAMAVEKREAEMIKQLLAKGADVNLKGKSKSCRSGRIGCRASRNCR